MRELAGPCSKLCHLSITVTKYSWDHQLLWEKVLFWFVVSETWGHSHVTCCFEPVAARGSRGYLLTTQQQESGREGRKDRWNEGRLASQCSFQEHTSRLLTPKSHHLNKVLLPPKNTTGLQLGLWRTASFQGCSHNFFTWHAVPRYYVCSIVWWVDKWLSPGYPLIVADCWMQTYRSQGSCGLISRFFFPFVFFLWGHVTSCLERSIWRKGGISALTYSSRGTLCIRAGRLSRRGRLLVTLRLSSGSKGKRKWGLTALQPVFGDSFPPGSLHFLKAPQPSQTAPWARDSVFKHTTLWGLFLWKAQDEHPCLFVLEIVFQLQHFSFPFSPPRLEDMKD